MVMDNIDFNYTGKGGKIKRYEENSFQFPNIHQKKKVLQVLYEVGKCIWYVW